MDCKFSDKDLAEIFKGFKRLSSVARSEGLSVPGVEVKVKAGKFRMIKIDGMKFIIDYPKKEGEKTQ